MCKVPLVFVDHTMQRFPWQDWIIQQWLVLAMFGLSLSRISLKLFIFGFFHLVIDTVCTWAGKYSRRISGILITCSHSLIQLTILLENKKKTNAFNYRTNCKSIYKERENGHQQKREG